MQIVNVAVDSTLYSREDVLLVGMHFEIGQDLIQLSDQRGVRART